MSSLRPASAAAPVAVVILAAGKGTRMKSDLPKVLHLLNGKPLLQYGLEIAEQLSSPRIVAVVGYGAEQVRRRFQGWPHLAFALQEPQLGTGHALMAASPFLKDWAGPVLIINGDVPNLTMKTINNLLRAPGRNKLTVLGMDLAEPKSYGRLVTQGPRLKKIVEFRDASAQERQITLINTGVYVADNRALQAYLPELTTDNEQKEYYLTDLVELMSRDGLAVGYCLGPDPWEVAGVNTQEELREMEARIQNSQGRAG